MQISARSNLSTVIMVFFSPYEYQDCGLRYIGLDQLLPYLLQLNILTLQSPVVTVCTTFFNTPKLCILPTQCIYVFRMVLTINSDCFPKQQ
jgi:hypothetical protein